MFVEFWQPKKNVYLSWFFVNENVRIVQIIWLNFVCYVTTTRSDIAVTIPNMMVQPNEYIKQQVPPHFNHKYMEINSISGGDRVFEKWELRKQAFKSCICWELRKWIILCWEMKPGGGGQGFWEMRINPFSGWELRKQAFKSWEMRILYLLRSEKMAFQTLRIEKLGNILILRIF